MIRAGRARRGRHPGRGARALPALPALLLTLSLATACTGRPPGSGAASRAASPTASAHAASHTAQGGAKLRARAARVLDRRARAIRHHDRSAFMADIDRSDPDFVAEQRRYFHNLTQLPLQVFDYRLGDDTWNSFFARPRWRDQAFIPYVRLRMQLRDFDTAPTVAVTGITFVPRGGRLVIVSDTDVNDRLQDGVGEQPWDLTRLTVRRSDHLLVLLDSRSRSDQDDIVRALEQAVATVDRVVPYHWTRRVVVYAVGSHRVLKAMDHVPGGDVNALGALTFPVYSPLRRSGPVAMRFLINPDLVNLPEPYLQRLVTHEMTHVAIGTRDDGVPVWLAEGLAEYVGVQDVPADYVRIDPGVLRRAERGVDGLPSSSTFNTVDEAWHYDLAWYACRWVADHRGEGTLWRLLAAMQHDGRGTTDAQQGRVLRRVVGVGPDRLARLAARGIVEDYGSG